MRSHHTFNPADYQGDYIGRVGALSVPHAIISAFLVLFQSKRQIHMVRDQEFN